MSKRRVLEIFSVQRGTPRESDTASRREEACLLNKCNVVAQLVTSQPDAVDLTLTCFSHTDVLGPSRIVRKQLASSTVHSAHSHVLRGFPLLHKQFLTSSFDLSRVCKFCTMGRGVDWAVQDVAQLRQWLVAWQD